MIASLRRDRKLDRSRSCGGSLSLEVLWRRHLIGLFVALRKLCGQPGLYSLRLAVSPSKYWNQSKGEAVDSIHGLLEYPTVVHRQRAWVGEGAAGMMPGG